MKKLSFLIFMFSVFLSAGVFASGVAAARDRQGGAPRYAVRFTPEKPQDPMQLLQERMKPGAQACPIKNFAHMEKLFEIHDASSCYDYPILERNYFYSLRNVQDEAKELLDSSEPVDKFLIYMTGSHWSIIYAHKSEKFHGKLILIHLDSLGKKGNAFVNYFIAKIANKVPGERCSTFVTGLRLQYDRGSCASYVCAVAMNVSFFMGEHLKSEGLKPHPVSLLTACATEEDRLTPNCVCLKNLPLRMLRGLQSVKKLTALGAEQVVDGFIGPVHNETKDRVDERGNQFPVARRLSWGNILSKAAVEAAVEAASESEAAAKGSAGPALGDLDELLGTTDNADAIW